MKKKKILFFLFFQKFTAHDRSHPRSSEIYRVWDQLLAKMIELGYRADSSWVTRPLHQHETVESVLCSHSERLAIGYNLIQEPIPPIIQVVKNLRVCGDCRKLYFVIIIFKNICLVYLLDHVTKLVAKIQQCEIIVRDANRIHHFFPNGQCSCQDHF